MVGDGEDDHVVSLNLSLVRKVEERIHHNETRNEARQGTDASPLYVSSAAAAASSRGDAACSHSKDAGVAASTTKIFDAVSRIRVATSAKLMMPQEDRQLLPIVTKMHETPQKTFEVNVDPDFGPVVVASGGGGGGGGSGNGGGGGSVTEDIEEEAVVPSVEKKLERDTPHKRRRAQNDDQTGDGQVPGNENDDRALTHDDKKKSRVEESSEKDLVTTPRSKLSSIVPMRKGTHMGDVVVNHDGRDASTLSVHAHGIFLSLEEIRRLREREAQARKGLAREADENIPTTDS